MPKVKWISVPQSKAPKPEVNHLAAVFRAYRKARNMTSEQIGKVIGCSAQNVRVQMNKPGREWNIGQLMRYCDVLEIPYEVALEAATK